MDKQILVSVCGNECVSTCSCFVCSGTFSVTSMMVGNVIQSLALDENFIVNGTNETTVNTDARDAYRVQIASSFAVLTGIIQVCVSVCVPILTKL